MSAEDVEAYDANKALIETRGMWLQLGRSMKAWAEGSSESMDGIHHADEAIRYAARAEVCLSRATGDDVALGDEFLDQIIASTPSETAQGEGL